MPINVWNLSASKEMLEAKMPSDSRTWSEKAGLGYLFHQAAGADEP